MARWPAPNEYKASNAHVLSRYLCLNGHKDEVAAPRTMLPAIEGKAVSAHFMLANSYSYSLSDWQYDIKAAQDAKIDAFALNMAYNPSTQLVSPTQEPHSIQTRSLSLTWPGSISSQCFSGGQRSGLQAILQVCSILLLALHNAENPPASTMPVMELGLKHKLSIISNSMARTQLTYNTMASPWRRRKLLLHFYVLHLLTFFLQLRRPEQRSRLDKHQISDKLLFHPRLGFHRSFKCCIYSRRCRRWTLFLGRMAKWHRQHDHKRR